MKRLRVLTAAMLLVLALCVTSFAATPVAGSPVGTPITMCGPQGPDPIIPPIK